MVNDFLHDAEKKQVTDGAVKRWLRELEALAFEADNVFDDISYQLLSKKVGPTENKTLMKKVKSFFSCSCSCSCSSNDHSIALRLQLGRRIKDLNELLKSINQQANEFGLQTINAQPPVSESPETNSFAVDPIFLGRKNDVSMIVEKLITATPSPAEQVLSVLPIVGMGGLGKTTLARAVFNHEQIKSHFGDNRVWVHVPRNFDVRNILKNILTSLKNEKVELETSQALLQKLQEHLGTKRYLLVLDDVWDEDRDKWDSFVNSLSGISSATGNCMIVTTRLQEVASIVKTGRVRYKFAFFWNRNYALRGLQRTVKNYHAMLEAEKKEKEQSALRAHNSSLKADVFPSTAEQFFKFLLDDGSTFTNEYRGVRNDSSVVMNIDNSLSYFSNKELYDYIQGFFNCGMGEMGER
ncbi:putative disease resistance protein rga4 [Phtheirospermum japonicum]|uniref:Putative disease resistance protein rga4 n=1 Tax=Phtheirospermum japonicum TaxID=374723 RepID=A0A830CGU8_9LAMI|nr:putative disease resistance protein rga4 [Phtheirospermum japonicum]